MPVFLASTLVIPSIAENTPSLVTNIQPEPILSQPEPVVEPVECSCVRYVESLIPGIPIINAIDYPLNTITPKVGDIIKLQYYNATTTNYIYHIALIEEISENSFKVTEANYERCKTGEREIEKSDERILGFFNPDRQRLIDALTPIQKETLWNESGWSMYKHNAVIRGSSGEWGVAQFMPSTWEYLTELRRRDNIKPILLDKMSFEDQITMFKFAFERGYQDWWMGYNKIYK